MIGDAGGPAGRADGLRDQYDDAIQAAKGHMEGAAEERDGKLYFNGTTKTQAEANRIWDAIKTVPEWANEIVADIKATGAPEAASAAGAYTVKSGDTLSKIAKDELGDASQYTAIFEANWD